MYAAGPVWNPTIMPYRDTETSNETYQTHKVVFLLSNFHSLEFSSSLYYFWLWLFLFRTCSSTLGFGFEWEMHAPVAAVFEFSGMTYLWAIWVRSDRDAGRAVAGLSPRQPLEEFLGDEGHDGRQEAEPHIQTGVESLPANVRLLVAFCVCSAQHRLHAFLQTQFIHAKVRRREARLQKAKEKWKVKGDPRWGEGILPDKHHTVRRARSCRWRWWLLGNRRLGIRFHRVPRRHWGGTKSTDRTRSHCRTAVTHRRHTEGGDSVNRSTFLIHH